MIGVITPTVYSKLLEVTKANCYEKETHSWVFIPRDLKETIRKMLKKHVDESSRNLKTAKLVKAGSPKQLVKEVFKEI